MKILLQNKNIALTNNSLISINSDNITENGSLVRIKQDSKNNIIKINNSLVRVKVTSVSSIVQKGTLINMNLDGTTRRYRVLKCNGNVAMVMGMFDNLTGGFSNASTTTTMGDLTVQKYEGSKLDTYLNNTWYNILSTKTKNAIISENIACDIWYWGNTGNPDHTGTFGTSVPGTTNYTISKYTGGVFDIGNRNVFALTVQDVIDYLSDDSVKVDISAILRNVNIWKMFWNDEVSHSGKLLWLRSLSASNSNNAWSVGGEKGSLTSIGAVASGIIRPALNIDLSKIEWSIATT